MVQTLEKWIRLLQQNNKQFYFTIEVWYDEYTEGDVEEVKGNNLASLIKQTDEAYADCDESGCASLCINFYTNPRTLTAMELYRKNSNGGKINLKTVKYARGSFVSGQVSMDMSYKEFVALCHRERGTNSAKATIVRLVDDDKAIMRCEDRVTTLYISQIVEDIINGMGYITNPSIFKQWFSKRGRL